METAICQRELGMGVGEIDNLTTLNPGSSERPRANTFRKTRNVTVKLLIFKKIKQSWGCGGLACSASKSPGLDNQLV